MITYGNRKQKDFSKNKKDETNKKSFIDQEA